MARDLFAERGIMQKPRDLFAERGIMQKPRDLFEENGIKPESKGWGGLASDIEDAALNAPAAAIGFALKIPHYASQLARQAAAFPVQVPKFYYKTYKEGYKPENIPKLLANLIDTGQNIAHGPEKLMDYLAQKQIIPKNNNPDLRQPYIDSGLTEEEKNPLAAALFSGGASLSKGLLTKSGITNKSIAESLSADKAATIGKATADYDRLFEIVKKAGVTKVPPPQIKTYDIVKNTQPKFHEALQKYIADPTFENAHWAQSDLGFIARHLQKIDERNGLSSTQHATLKNVLAAQNRIKQAMFKDNNLAKIPELEQNYNQLTNEYAKNVVPYKQLQELSDYENKKLTASNLMKSLYNNDEFRLGLGKEKYNNRLLINAALRSKFTKLLGTTSAISALGGAGFKTGENLVSNGYRNND